MPRLATALLALALGAAAAFALVSCGDDEEDEQALLPGDTAEAILANLDAVEEAVAAGECDEAAENVETIQNQIAALDRPVSRKLRQNLSEGAELLAERIAEECEPAAATTAETTVTTESTETTDTTDEETTETTETTGEEPTTTDETTTTQEPAQPEPPTEPPAQPEPPTTPPEDSGGVSPGGVAGGGN